MRFDALELAGAFMVRSERHADERGWFARTFCRDEFTARGLLADFVQCSASFNARRGTLRGMHFQRAPYSETKLARCTRGVVFDVLLDLRPRSRTFRCWHAAELSEENGVAVYIPAGVAHGFQTLTDAAEVFYQITERYVPGSSSGVRWNDPAFRIDWPIRPPILSDRDGGYCDYHEGEWT